MSGDEIPDGPYSYMTGWHWQEYQKAKKAAADYRGKFYGGKEGTTLNPPDVMADDGYIRLRFHEETALNAFVRSHLNDIGEGIAKDRQRTLRKQYGLASQRIHELRQDIRILRDRLALFRAHCTCGADKRVADDTATDESYRDQIRRLEEARKRQAQLIRKLMA